MRARGSLAALAALLAAVAALAAAPAPDRGTRAERIARQGGEIVRRGAFRGRVSIVNRQTRLPLCDCEAVARLFAEQTRCNVVVDGGEGAAVRLYVVDDPAEPTSLLAPEERWGRVNVAKLVDDLPGEGAKRKFFAPRARKMLVKTLSLLMGGGASQFPGNVMNAVGVRDLDPLPESIPVDVADHNRAYLKAVGVTPMEKTTYLRACREGWAPAPTNEVQRAIWERVYAVPKAPLKIEFDPKTGR